MIRVRILLLVFFPISSLAFKQSPKFGSMKHQERFLNPRTISSLDFTQLGKSVNSIYTGWVNSSNLLYPWFLKGSTIGDTLYGATGNRTGMIMAGAAVLGGTGYYFLNEINAVPSLESMARQMTQATNSVLSTFKGFFQSFLPVLTERSSSDNTVDEVIHTRPGPYSEDEVMHTRPGPPYNYDALLKNFSNRTGNRKKELEIQSLKKYVEKTVKENLEDFTSIDEHFGLRKNVPDRYKPLSIPLRYKVFDDHLGPFVDDQLEIWKPGVLYEREEIEDENLEDIFNRVRPRFRIPIKKKYRRIRTGLPLKNKLQEYISYPARPKHRRPRIRRPFGQSIHQSTRIGTNQNTLQNRRRRFETELLSTRRRNEDISHFKTQDWWKPRGYSIENNLSQFKQFLHQFGA